MALTTKISKFRKHLKAKERNFNVIGKQIKMAGAGFKASSKSIGKSLRRKKRRRKDPFSKLFGSRI